MARLLFAESFLDDVSRLDRRVEDMVWAQLELVQAFPGVGSSLVEPMLVQAFGERCLKVTAAGYDVLYERSGAQDDGGEETVCVLGIVSQRRVR